MSSQLLRNIQLMMDAATLLMNQYSTIAPTFVSGNQQPQQQQQSPLSTTSVDYLSTTDSPRPSESDSKKQPTTAAPGVVNSEASTSKLDLSKEVSIEDIGSEEDRPKSQGDQQPTSTLITPATAENDSSAPSADLNEVRRRWNQKFAQQNNTTQ